jgi:hypothetical protein
VKHGGAALILVYSSLTRMKNGRGFHKMLLLIKLQFIVIAVFRAFVLCEEKILYSQTVA